MKDPKKWTGWLLICAVVLVVGITLVMSTLAGPQPDPYPDEQPHSQPPVHSTASPLPSAQPVRPDSRTANASVMGYAGPVLVRLTLDDNGAIREADIGGARFMETEGVGSKVRDDAFVQTLQGKKPPLELGRDIDAVAGATVSSTAAVEAVNRAYAFIMEQSTEVK